MGRPAKAQIERVRPAQKDFWQSLPSVRCFRVMEIFGIESHIFNLARYYKGSLYSEAVFTVHADDSVATLTLSK